MTKILTMPAMATESTTVCYTVTHYDLIDFAREIIERTKEMDEAEKAETSVSVEDGYYTRKEVMALLRRTAGFRTLTEYVREASVNAEVVQNFIQKHNAAFRDLSGLCNNLNQLTRLAHAQGLQSTEGALSGLLPQVMNLITHLHKEMKRQK